MTTPPVAEHFFEAVATELETQGVRKGLWARAFAQSDGDDSKAKALYIYLRASQLQADQENAARAAIETEARRLEAQEETGRAERQARQAALLSGGYPKALSLARRACAVGLGHEVIRLQLESHNFTDLVINQVLDTLAS